jgi:hypothetical protein
MTRTAAGPDLPSDPFPGHVLPRLLKVALALLVAASAILLAG